MSEVSHFIVLFLAITSALIGTWIKIKGTNIWAVVALCCALGGFLHALETNYLSVSGISRPLHAVVRMIRMVLVWVALPWWLMSRQNFKDYGPVQFGLGPPSHSRISTYLSGIGLYGLALLMFVSFPPKNSGFRFWSFAKDLGGPTVLDWTITLPALCVMAAITDIFTRGFVLLNLKERIGTRGAIITQNILWILLHLYELELLSSAMGWLGAIALALALGVLGDIIALKTGSVRPLMLGHALLNAGWAISASL